MRTRSNRRPRSDRRRPSDRHRSRPHLDFVKTLRCIVCGAYPPNDPHHLKFVQLRAMQLKSGDQWAVPMCRPHHEEVEDAGDERAWWESKGIDPIPLAIELWSMSVRANRGPPDGQP